MEQLFKLSFLITLIYTNYCNVNANNFDEDKQSKIDDLIETTIMSYSNHIPALGLSIVRNDKVLYSNGFGYKNVDKREEANENTSFAIASITKSFTALLAVKILHEKFPHLGEAVLDTPINDLVPEYNFTVFDDKIRTEMTTMRDLLSHRSCLIPDLLGLLSEAYESPEDLIIRQRFAREKCSFRNDFVYNNGMYTLAGDIIKTIANNSLSFVELMEDLFKEIGMNDSSFISKTDKWEDFPNRSVPYYWKHGKYKQFNPELLKNVVVNAPAGGIISNAYDMGKYMQFHLNLGKVNEKQLIPKDVMKWLYKSNIITPESDRSTFYKTSPSDISEFDFGYALGLSIGIYDGYKKVSHSGNIPPYESNLSLYPDLNLGIFTVTSGPGNIPVKNGHHFVHAKIFDTIEEFQRPVKSTLTYTKSSMKTENNVKIATDNVTQILSSTLITSDLSGFVGHYGNALAGDMEITLKSNLTSGTSELYMNYGRWGQGFLTIKDIKNNCSNLIFGVRWDSDFNQFVDSTSGLDFIADFSKVGKLKVYVSGNEDNTIIYQKGFHSKNFINKTFT